MLSSPGTVFLLDVDNTLLDNDAFAADLRGQLRDAFGEGGCRRYLELYEQRRDAQGYADYLGALQDFRAGLADDGALPALSAWLLDYPFEERVYPGALAAIAHLATLGLPVIVSDGDIVFQPRKIHRSGLAGAVGGRVLVQLHKERQLAETQDRYPAAHYVVVDDKPLLLAAIKRQLGERATTVFVRQGHYAVEQCVRPPDPLPDRTIGHIADLCRWRAADCGSREAAAASTHTCTTEQP
jgi:FMN phosphatase YigB (HAD superfamily)